MKSVYYNNRLVKITKALYESLKENGILNEEDEVVSNQSLSNNPQTVGQQTTNVNSNNEGTDLTRKYAKIVYDKQLKDMYKEMSLETKELIKAGTLKLSPKQTKNKIVDGMIDYLKKKEEENINKIVDLFNNSVDKESQKNMSKQDVIKTMNKLVNDNKIMDLPEDLRNLLIDKTAERNEDYKESDIEEIVNALGTKGRKEIKNNQGVGLNDKLTDENIDDTFKDCMGMVQRIPNNNKMIGIMHIYMNQILNVMEHIKDSVASNNNKKQTNEAVEDNSESNRLNKLLFELKKMYIRSAIQIQRAYIASEKMIKSKDVKRNQLEKMLKDEDLVKIVDGLYNKLGGSGRYDRVFTNKESMDSIYELLNRLGLVDDLSGVTSDDTLYVAGSLKPKKSSETTQTESNKQKQTNESFDYKTNMFSKIKFDYKILLEDDEKQIEDSKNKLEDIQLYQKYQSVLRAFVETIDELTIKDEREIKSLNTFDKLANFTLVGTKTDENVDNVDNWMRYYPSYVVANKLSEFLFNVTETNIVKTSKTIGKGKEPNDVKGYLDKFKELNNRELDVKDIDGYMDNIDMIKNTINQCQHIENLYVEAHNKQFIFKGYDYFITKLRALPFQTSTISSYKKIEELAKLKGETSMTSFYKIALETYLICKICELLNENKSDNSVSTKRYRLMFRHKNETILDNRISLEDIYNTTRNIVGYAWSPNSRYLLSYDKFTKNYDTSRSDKDNRLIGERQMIVFKKGDRDITGFCGLFVFVDYSSMIKKITGAVSNLLNKGLNSMKYNQILKKY